MAVSSSGSPQASAQPEQARDDVSHASAMSGRDRSGRLPLHAVLDAFDAWQAEPTPDLRARLARAFGAVVEANGIRGGFLRLSAPPLPAVELASGSLADATPALLVGREERVATHHRTIATTDPRAATDPPAAAAADAAASAAADAATADAATADTADARAGTQAALRHYDLNSVDRPLAELWLDVPADEAAAAAAEECARALDVAVDAAWSRVRARLAADELAALDAATRAIAGVLDLDRVLQLITDRVRSLASAQYAALGIVDQEGQIERFFTSGITRQERERIGPPPRGHGLLGVIVRDNRPLRIPDIATDPRRYGFPPNHPEMHSLLGVPVNMKGHSIGRLYLTNKTSGGEFTEDDQRLVETFALHASIAIENARLHEQVQRLAVVEERERIGRDLHDGIIQSIYAVGLGLEDVPDLMEDEPDVARARVERAIESLDQTIRDIRNFIFGLRPELLEQAGLVGGLAALADEFRVNSLVDVDLDTASAEEAELPADLTGQLLSIAREALSNIARHSKATRGSVRVDTGGGEVRLAISDNGVGFEPNRPRGPSHQGLLNMQARAQEIGGRLEIDSEPGRGTRIIVVIPNRAADGSDEGA